MVEIKEMILEDGARGRDACSRKKPVHRGVYSFKFWGAQEEGSNMAKESLSFWPAGRCSLPFHYIDIRLHSSSLLFLPIRLPLVLVSACMLVVQDVVMIGGKHDAPH